MSGFSRLLLMAALSCAAAIGFAAETLDVTFDRAREVTLGDKKIKIAGNFKDGFMALGTAGVAFPAAELGLNRNAGTILFSLKFDPFKAEMIKSRYMVTLRTAGRLSMNFLFTPAKTIYRVHTTDQVKPAYYNSKELLEPNRVYQMGATWDGTSIKIYLDGVLQGVLKQEWPLDKTTALNVGPYRDGYYNNSDPMPGDCHIARLRVWNTALTPAEMLSVCGVKPTAAMAQHPALLTVPALTGAAPAINGTLDDPAWSRAASMIGLADGSVPEAGWRQPANGFKALYDRDNLYLGVWTVFPGRVPVRIGDRRTPDKEPEVWGSESLEFYFKVKGETYRFAGNVAGGYTEGKGIDCNWNGDWQYRTSMKMRIDDTQLFEAEAVIPWSTLGLNGPPADDLEFNFCRSWLLPEVGIASSLSPNGRYDREAWFTKMRFVQDAPALQVVKQNNPADGMLEQEISLSAARDGSIRYNIDLLNLDGTAKPQPVQSSTFPVKPGENSIRKVSTPITYAGYDAMLFTLADGENVVMRQILPFKLNEEFFKVTPRFYQEKLNVTIKNNLLRDKLGAGAGATLELADTSGKILSSTALNGQDEVPIAFPRANPAGKYRLALRNTADGKEIFAREVEYPGIGEWESMTFDNRIIPPFTAMTFRTDADRSFTATMWGRQYQWQQGELFPVAISSQNSALLNGPVTLRADGQPLPGAELKVGLTADHRAELITAGQSGFGSVRSESWIEYDGVEFNKVSFKAARTLDKVTLMIPIKPEIARFLHTSDSYTWGSRLTEKLRNGTRDFRYYPVVWLGNEEKGLAFFAESRHDWKTKAEKVCAIVQSDDQTYLEIRLADAMKPGEVLNFEFGLLASPVKPLPENYPLNTFHSALVAGMNRPNDPLYTLNFQSNNISRAWDTCWDEWIPQSVEKVARFNGVVIPYQMNSMLSDEYPEVRAFKDDWTIVPEVVLDYTRNDQKHNIYWMCPTTDASKFFISKFKTMLKRYKIGGIYFDFGIIPVCDNRAHGCFERSPLLAEREFYRRIALCQLDAGIKEPVTILHNTDSVQLPAMTFATHLFNGENLRQHSSSILHNGKDLLDTYDITPFASELSSLPFGLTNSVYHAQDNLLPQFGGTGEDPELYKFRLTRAVMAGTLVHNTMPSISRLHYGIFDKVLRAYKAFDVPRTEFLGYWKHPAKVRKGNDIYVSVYKHKRENKILAVISHIGKPHDNQEVEIEFDAAKLGLKPFNHATELMTQNDPAYAELFKLRRDNGIAVSRAELKLGDFGTEIESMKDNLLKLKLNYHSFALVELTP